MSGAAGAETEVRFASGPAGAIAYRDIRPDLAETMVFVHGINMASGVWNQMAATLPGYRCLVFDLRGHGLSAFSGPYDIDAYVADLAAVIAATGVRNFQLVGVSMGGLVSCAYAQRHPSLVRSVVTFGSAFVGQHMGLEAGMARLREAGVRDYLTWSLPRGSLPPNTTQEVRDKAIELAVAGREDVDMIEEIIRSTADQDLAHLLTGPIAAPALVVNGEYDETCTPEGGRELALTIGGTWHLFPGAGHILPLEQPARCAVLVSDFYPGSARAGVTHPAEETL